LRKNPGWVPLLAIAVAIFLLPVVRGVYEFPLFYMVFLYSVLFWTAQSTSWNILSGYSGYFSFGQGAFYGVGIYTMAVLFGRHGYPWLLVVLLGGVFALVLALAVGTIAFRLRSLRGEIFALLTLAIPFILGAAARISNGIDGGQGVIIPVPQYPGFIGSFQEFIFLLGGVVALFALTVAYVMGRTRYGWALFAIHDAEDVAEGLGVPTFRHKMIAIGANGLIAGLSGAVSALQIGFVTVEGTFNLRVPLFVIVMSVLGGRRHWAGPMVGAIFIVTMQNRLAAAELEGWSLIILGVSLVLLVVLAPEGLMARFLRRPRRVVGVFVGVLAALAIYGSWGDPVTWLAVALAAAAVTAFLPGGGAGDARNSERQGGEVPAALAPEASAPEIGRPVIVASEVTKSFGGVEALRGVSMSVSEGELVGLVGPNGSGKTTLVNLISGSFPPTGGSITMNGTNLAGLAPHRIVHLGIARTYQIPRPFPSLTLRDNVAIAIMFGRQPRGLDAARAAAEEYLVLVGLDHRATAFPNEINLHERQLLEMARAMATRPSLLFLDEALAGLNPVEIDSAVAVVQRIHRSGVAIVLVEHLLRVVNQLATRIVVLDQGRELAEGDPVEVMKDPAVVAAYLGSEAHAGSD
jgi:branched-chain amino acid transport system permease protein